MVVSGRLAKSNGRVGAGRKGHENRRVSLDK